MTALDAALMTAAASLVATPIFGRLASLVGATDRPGGRRVHEQPTPRGGGLAVAVAAAILCAVEPRILHGLGPYVAGGLLLVLLTGLADDLVPLSPRTKLLGQAAAALLAVASGLRLWLFAGDGSLALLDRALTVLWIMLVTNAFNLSDGLDGLAAGVGLIALGGLAVLGGGQAAVATAALAGGLLGFLPYNLHPARIFLGDAGSLTMGYAVAIIPLARQADDALAPVALFLVVAVPLTDLLLAVARRFCSRCLRVWGEGLVWTGLVEGLRNTVRPDRRHIHHRLLDLGLGQRRAVLALYGAAVVTAALAVLVTHASAWPVDLLALGGGLVVVGLVRALGFDELRPAHSGLLLPILRRLGRRRDVVLAVDLVLAAAAYATALFVTGANRGGIPATIAALGVMAAAEVAGLAVFGAYRTAWETAGIGGLALLVRASAAATIAGYVAVRLAALPGGGAATIVYLALVVPAVALLRLSPRVVAQTARRGGVPERTLICGTASEARHALARVRRAASAPLTPIGFVELRPRWQGAHVQRLPVLGTLDALGELLHEHDVRHLVVADPHLRGPALDWVRAVCRQVGVQVYHYSEALVPDQAVAPASAVADVAALR